MKIGTLGPQELWVHIYLINSKKIKKFKGKIENKKEC